MSLCGRNQILLRFQLFCVEKYTNYCIYLRYYCVILSLEKQYYYE